MTTINLILLATLLLVVILEGFNWFSIWTGVPLLLAAVLVELSMASGGGDLTRVPAPKRLGLIGLIAGVVALTLYEHVTLFFGLGLEPDAAAGRFGYILAPLYAIVGGGVGYTLGYVYGQKVSSGSRPDGPLAPPDERTPPSGAE